MEDNQKPALAESRIKEWTGDGSADEHSFDLASILNILWRRRILFLAPPLLGILVGIAYGIWGTRRWEAVATMRPGITAYDSGNEPIRQWQVKDVSRWYDAMLYQPKLNAKLSIPAESYVAIQVDFIPQGLTNRSGGQVITLSTIAASPELARTTLDLSIVVFNEYAAHDSVSSQIELSRIDLELKVASLEKQLKQVDHDDARIDLEIVAAQAESSKVAQKGKELAVVLQKIRSEATFADKRIEKLGNERDLLKSDSNWLMEASGLSGSTPNGEDLEYLASARGEVRRAMSSNQAQSDSLAHSAELASLDAERAEIAGNATLLSDRRASELKLGELRLQREMDLEARRGDLAQQIEAWQKRLQMLSPLQRVGDTIVSVEPVRPRPLRATVILLFLGTMGGLVLAFGMDYLLLHRRRIFRS